MPTVLDYFGFLFRCISSAGLDTLFAFMPYGQGWRRCRRAFWQQFYPSALPEYRPAQLTTAHKLLSKLLKDPEGCEGHIR